jgi:hypothetical protein
MVFNGIKEKIVKGTRMWFGLKFIDRENENENGDPNEKYSKRIC